MTIKLIITDDHPMVLKGLRNMLASYTDIEILSAYTNGKSLLEGLDSFTPDVILLDLMMPEMNGDEILKRIKKKHPSVRVIILSNHGSPIYVNNMIHLGVSGYLTKTVEDNTFYEAIQEVMNGKQFIEPELLEKVDRLNEGIKRTVALKYALSPREKKVLQLIVDGYSSSKIAKMLFLSIHTIDTYRDSMMLKLEAKNIAALVKIAIKSELVTL